MNNETASINDRDLLEHQRDVVMQHLMPIIDAIDRKRHALTDAVGRVLPSRSELAKVPGRDRTIFVAVGVLAGVAAITVVARIGRWRRERNRAINRVGRALSAFAPVRPSIVRTALRVVGSAVFSQLAELAELRVMAMVRDRAERASDADARDVLNVSPAPASSPLTPPKLPDAAVSASTTGAHTPPPLPLEALANSTQSSRSTLTGLVPPTPGRRIT
ncbi:MAG: hypothetical protein U0326_13535 [Polyangiales bacterium]